MTDAFDDRLSRAVSLMLRHDPSRFGLSLDDNGWAALPGVLAALQQADAEWAALTIKDLEVMTARAKKRRHEISGDRIGALYGHSTPDVVTHTAGVPPNILFHGTSQAAWEVIQEEGLKPMRRQYVHLSVDRETAEAVGRRKAKSPVILRVLAGDAHRAGIEFMVGNDAVWLVSHLPRGFILLGE